MCLKIFWKIQAIWPGNEGRIECWRGFGELLEEAPIGLEMDMSEILLESLRWGGSYFLEGVREKGGSDEPPPRTPPGYGPGDHTRMEAI